jgi:hypothetical protein
MPASLPTIRLFPRRSALDVECSMFNVQSLSHGPRPNPTPNRAKNRQIPPNPAILSTSVPRYLCGELLWSPFPPAVLVSSIAHSILLFSFPPSLLRPLASVFSALLPASFPGGPRLDPRPKAAKSGQKWPNPAITARHAPEPGVKKCSLMAGCSGRQRHNPPSPFSGPLCVSRASGLTRSRACGSESNS